MAKRKKSTRARKAKKVRAKSRTRARKTVRVSRPSAVIRQPLNALASGFDRFVGFFK